MCIPNRLLDKKTRRFMALANISLVIGLSLWLFVHPSGQARAGLAPCSLRLSARLLDYRQSLRTLGRPPLPETDALAHPRIAETAPAPRP